MPITIDVRRLLAALALAAVWIVALTIVPFLNGNGPPLAGLIAGFVLLFVVNYLAWPASTCLAARRRTPP